MRGHEKGLVYITTATALRPNSKPKLFRYRPAQDRSPATELVIAKKV